MTTRPQLRRQQGEPKKCQTCGHDINRGSTGGSQNSSSAHCRICQVAQALGSPMPPRVRPLTPQQEYDKAYNAKRKLGVTKR